MLKVGVARVNSGLQEDQTGMHQLLQTNETNVMVYFTSSVIKRLHFQVYRVHGWVLKC